VAGEGAGGAVSDDINITHAIRFEPPITVSNPMTYYGLPGQQQMVSPRLGRMLIIDGDDRVAVYELVDDADGKRYMFRGQVELK
jgi:hypothetical protein